MHLSSRMMRLRLKYLSPKVVIVFFLNFLIFVRPREKIKKAIGLHVKNHPKTNKLDVDVRLIFTVGRDIYKPFTIIF